jgi:hypothetical protein
MLRDPAVAWQLAGLTTEGGLMGRSPIPPYVPTHPEEFWIADGRLYWRGGPVFEAVPTEGLLDAFVRIDSEPDVLRFAIQFGPLGLCRHGFPSGHCLDGHQFLFDSPSRRQCFPSRPAPASEPVAGWFVYARAARAMLNLAAALHNGTLGRPEDWADAFESVPRDQDVIPPDPTDIAKTPLTLIGLRHLLADLINEWLLLGDVRPRLLWEEGAGITFDAGTFGAMAVQLMQAVSRTNGLAICSSCGLPYMRTGRKAPQGRRNYCPDCGLGAAMRDAQRAHRQRKRKGDGEAKS